METLYRHDNNPESLSKALERRDQLRFYLQQIENELMKPDRHDRRDIITYCIGTKSAIETELRYLKSWIRVEKLRQGPAPKERRDSDYYLNATFHIILKFSQKGQIMLTSKQLMFLKDIDDYLCH